MYLFKDVETTIKKAVARMRDPQKNPTGYKNWQKKTDLHAFRCVCRALGIFS